MNTLLGYTGTVINRTTESLSHFVTAVSPAGSVGASALKCRGVHRTPAPFDKGALMFPIIPPLFSKRGGPLAVERFIQDGSTQGTRTIPTQENRPRVFLISTQENRPRVFQENRPRVFTRQRRISLFDIIEKFHRLRFHTAKPYITEHRSPSSFLASGTLLQLIFLLVFF